MSERKWCFFPFDAMDYKAAQAYLDKKAEQGWALDRIYLGRIARYVPAQGRYHFVDLELRQAFDDGPNEDYLQLCQDAGWELIPRTRGLLIFRSQPGKHPAPIQGDDEIEAERFWKKHIRKNFIITAVLFLLFLGLIGLLFSRMSSSPAFSSLLLSNSGLAFLLFLLTASAVLLWQAGAILRRYARWRKTGTLSTERYKSAFVRGVLGVLVLLLYLVCYTVDLAEDLGAWKSVDLFSNPFSEEDTADRATLEEYPILLSSDLGLDWDASSSRRLEGKRSIFISWLKYTELTDDNKEGLDALVTEHYRCTGNAVAHLLLKARLQETTGFRDLFYGNIQWSPLGGTGFDECWADADGSHLLLQQDSVVVLIGAAGFDLTTAENLNLILTQVLG